MKFAFPLGRRMASACAASLCLVVTSASAQTYSLDPELAAAFFRQLGETSARDGRKLWGKPLYGPIFFVDRKTRDVVANQADPAGVLKQVGTVFVGSFPKDRNIANSAIDWLGEHWTMVAWPVPEWRQARERLLLHECFHRIQDSIGLRAHDAVNNHLDTLNGRIWLQMEWRALERALRQAGPAREQAIKDALLFRAYRRSLFPNSSQTENNLELNEGLAEYTGIKLSSETIEELAVRADQAIRDSRSTPTFARSFAYVSGPAYGALLDMARTPWRRRIAAEGDLGRALAAAHRISFPQPDEKAVQASASRYQGDEVVAVEKRRDEKRQRDLAAARRRFIEGPVLALPVTSNVKYSFDPNNVVSIDAANTLYPTLRLVDEWGILEAADGAWVMRNESGAFTRAQLEAPTSLSARPLTGKGWTLELKEGWRVVPGERSGDFLVSQASPP
jgi:hypothetical protein